jgi:hypothetical protein
MDSAVRSSKQESRMAQIVFTNVERIEHLATAKWNEGNQNSYEATKRMARATGDGLLIIGRQDSNGSVQPAFAATQATEWSAVNGWHLTLAKFFVGKLAEAPAGDTLAPFFDEIEPGPALTAAQQLMATHDGGKEAAARAVNQALRALGVPAGDWTHAPLLAA